MKNFISVEEFKNLKSPVILDVRTNLTDDSYGEKVYDEGHIPGAYYLDLNKDLSGSVSEDTGNHPLPELDDFKIAMEKTGATNSDTFVIYDDGSNTTAARLWFLLKFFGFEKVYVLNGGMKEYVNKGNIITKERPSEDKGKIDLIPNDEMLSSYEEVLEFSKGGIDGKILVDSRSYDRYLGHNETLYDKAGHIPGAKSYFFGDNYNEKGMIKEEEELKERFKDLYDVDLIVSCGSGVTACSNIIAMDEAGLNPRLYVGSYSQWIKKGNDVVTKDE